jgi:hypothetical protein
LFFQTLDIRYLEAAHVYVLYVPSWQLEALVPRTFHAHYMIVQCDLHTEL